jgi:hypothetical protein
MIRVFFKLVISAVLAVVVFIASLFAWGTTHNHGRGISWPVLIVSLIIGASCLWGLVLVWRRSDDDGDVPFRPIAFGRTRNPPSGEAFDDAAFSAWLSANQFDSVDLPPETMAQLRQRFLEQQQ